MSTTGVDDSEGRCPFFSKLNVLTNEDPKRRPSLASVLDIFISSPHKMELPDYSF
jgi:hypothetical protein